jgi:hypothetical protein
LDGAPGRRRRGRLCRSRVHVRSEHRARRSLRTGNPGARRGSFLGP